MQRITNMIVGTLIFACVAGILPGAGDDDAATARQKAADAQAALEADISYGDGGDQQKLDLYLPAKKSFTTIVFTFGGGWHSGSRKAVAPIGKKLQQLGFGCALLSHRLSPKDKFPAQIEDVAAAFAWVKKNIESRGGDSKRVFLMGHSSGAQLSLLLAADGQYLAKHKLSPADIAGVIGLSSPVDLEPRQTGKGFGDALLAGRGADVFSRNPEMMKNASPIRHVTKNLPPTLLVVGERDFPMLATDAQTFVDKAKKSGAEATLFVAKGRDHMGVVQAITKDADPILERVLGFVGKAKMKDD
jgi:acetyl esterase/lipase